MKKHEENGLASGGNGELTREALERRARELENENRQLRAKMAQMEADWDLDRQSLEWYRQLGMPVSEVEMLERAKTGPSISDVLAECEREFTAGRR
jgi:multidrug resistance efflux pump